MDKSNSLVNTFIAYVDQLRNTECSQKEKIACFQHIAECIMSPALVAHINYATHCSTATNVLLLFCEDLDSVVRMSAEENLNKIFRALEKTRISRILMDLYGEIKRNGNQRSLRICLNLFSYYAPQIKEKQVKLYALRILPCLQTIAQRKETQLCETLCDFVKSFGIYLQQGLTDSEICKLFEVFMANIGVECAVKRRCSSQNCISLIENSRNKNLMAKHGLNKVIELLLNDQQTHSVLGALGFLRLLLPLIIRGFTNDCPDDGEAAATIASNNKKTTYNSTLTTTITAATTTATATTKTVMSTITNESSRQIIEIYDYCLHLLSTSNTSNHSTINAALEVINAVLQTLDSTTIATSSNNSNNNNNTNNNVIAKSLQQLLSNQQLQHNEYLRKRKSLKNQIFQLKNYEMTTTAAATTTRATKRTGTEVAVEAAATTTKKATDAVTTTAVAGASTISANVVKQQQQQRQQQQHIRNSARSISECVEDDVDGAVNDADAEVDACDEDEEEDDFTTLSEINEPQQTFTLLTTTVDVDNLIDAIVATNTSTNTNTNTVNTNVNATTINTANANEIQQSLQQQQQQQHMQPQNLLNVSSITTTGNTSTSCCGAGGDGATNIGDDKSQLLSDIDNESFNSIDFEAEITIGGTAAMGVDAVHASNDGGGGSIAGGSSSKSNSDTIGSFFNNLISNAATESVSKLFSKSSSSSAPAAAVKSTPTKTSTPHADKSDVISTASTSIATDNLSLISAASSSKRFDSLSAVEEQQLESAGAQHARTSSNVSSIVGAYDDTLSRTASITASTAVLADSNAKSTAADDSGDDADAAEVLQRETEVEYRRKPNVNPFLSENSPLKQTVPDFPLLTLKIGTIYEQSMLYYTARFVSARFLLTGQVRSLHSDTSIRVSIKSLSLNVLAQCVRLIPEVLHLPLEITESELRLLELHDLQLQQTHQASQSDNAIQNYEVKSNSESGGSPSSMPHSDSSSSILGKDYEHLDARGDFVDFIQKPSFQTPLIVSDLPDESMLLDIKDDHFGKSTCDYFNLNEALSKSADPVLMSAKPMVSTSTSSSAAALRRPALPPRPAGLKQMFQPLSKSEIIDAKSSNKKTVIVTESSEDIPPPMLPPRPPKRTKSMRKSIVGSTAAQMATQQYQAELQQQQQQQQQQNLADILLYYNHTDPILRGGVQQIVGNFIQATGAGLTLRLQLNLQHLLAILLKGLQDEIHTVVIQALNAFDKIFPHVVSKYLMGPSCHYQQQQQQQQQRQGRQQCKHTSVATTATATTTTTAIFSAASKCQDNAGQKQKHHQPKQQQEQQQRQQYTNDAAAAAAAECLNTQTCLKTTNTPSYCCCFSAVVTTCPPTLFNDNDELIAALLNAFQLQSKCCCNDNENSTHAATCTTSTTSQAAAGCRLNTATTTTTASGTFTISPKLLLNKLRLCHHNKYWLVQNKYAEVISNLNYAALHSYYGNASNYNNNSNSMDADNGNATSVTAAAISANVATASTPTVGDVNDNHVLVDDNADIVCSYETIFLDELLQLIGDDDFRVREHAAECLCRFIIQSAMQQQKQLLSAMSTATSPISKPLNKQTETSKIPTTTTTLPKSCSSSSSSMETYQTNFDLLWDFFDYRIFSGMSLSLRNLFRANSSILPPLSYTLLPASATSSLASLAASSGLSSSASAMSSATMAASTFGGAAARNDAAAAFCAVGNNSYAATFAMQRQMAQEEKLLAKVLYRMTNKLMALNDKNLQFGIIYTLKLLLKYFNFADYQRAWSEFNLMEICMKFSYYNYTTAVDLNCQNDLIDVTGKLIAGSILISGTANQQHQQQLDQLLTHLMKIINIYYHLFTNQKPLLFAKAQKSDLFTNAKELAIVQSVGYFGNDYVYIKLYNILRSANDSYKITINQESGSLLISLLKTCLNSLSLCIELRTHSATIYTPTTTMSSNSTSPSAGTATTAMASGSLSLDAVFPSTSSSSSSSSAAAAATGTAAVTNTVLKLIEEILHYLTKLINYAPGECIACLRQLLKYLFGQNYGNRQQDYYATFIGPYFVAKSKGQRQQKRSNSYSSSSNRNNCSNDNEKYNNKTLFSSSNAMMQTINSSAAAAIAITTKLTTPTMTSSTAAGQCKEQGNFIVTTHANYSVGAEGVGGPGMRRNGTSSVAQDYHLLGELFESGLNFHTWKWEREGDCAKYIKLFEPLVIFCLTLFMKANAKVQAPIIELLSQLLDLNVTYSVLDSKNVIFDQIINNLDLIENGIARNAHLLIPPMIKFLIQLTHKSDRKLITIPKIISITNNLLANNTIRECSILALKSLAYEIFFMSEHTGTGVEATKLRAEQQRRAPFQSPVTRSPIMSLSATQQRHAAELEAAAAAAEAAEALLANKRELDTQKEVVLGMLEKFIDAIECQQVLSLLLLRERSAQQLDSDAGGNTAAAAVVVVGDINEANNVSAAGGNDVFGGHTLQTTLLHDPNVVYAIVCRCIYDGRLRVDDWRNFFMLDAFFRNNERNVLADSKGFLTLLQLFIAKDVANFCDLSYATIILANVILKTEEIYLVNHIKLYLKNHPMVEEREKRQQQQQHQYSQQHTTPHWWMHDGPSTSSAAAAARAAAGSSSSGCAGGGATVSEINYFAKVLCGKLEACFDCLLLQPLQHQHGNHFADPHHQQQQQQQQRGYYDVQYCSMAARFVRALHDVCCRSRHKDALQSVFRLVLAESGFLDKYYYFLTMSSVMPTPTVGAAMLQPSLTSATTAVNASDADDNDADNVEADDAAALLQLEVFKLLSAMKLLDPLVLLQQFQTVGIKWNVQRTLLREICLQNCNVNHWKLQQVQQLFNATFLNLLITEHTQFVCNLCAVNVEFCMLWLKTLLQHVNVLNKHSIRTLLHLMLLRICANTHHQQQQDSSSSRATLKCFQLLNKLHRLHSTNRILQLQLERLAQRLLAALSITEKKAIWEGKRNLHNDDNSPLLTMLLYLNNSEFTNNASAAVQMTLVQRIIDEKWLFLQLIKFSTLCGYDPQQLTRILLEIQSENKLYKIFTSETFNVTHVLRHAIASSLQAMLATFRNKCIQHNPHIHYMQPNPLARVSCNVLMSRIDEIVDKQQRQQAQQHEQGAATVVNATAAVANVMASTSASTSESLYLCSALIALIESIKQIEATALIYIDAKFIDKFVREHLLRPEHIATLLSFLQWCTERAKILLLSVQSKQQQKQEEQQPEQQVYNDISILLHCIEALLQQKFIWHELNQIEKVMHSNRSIGIAAGSNNSSNNILTLQQRNVMLCSVLDVLVLAATLSLQNTIFYKRYKMQMQNDNNDTAMQATMLPSALDIAKEKQEAKDAAGNVVDADAAVAACSTLLLLAYAPKAIFIAKLIETKIDIDVARSGMLSSAYITGSDGSGGATSGFVGTTHAAVIGDFDGMNLELNAYVPMHLLEAIGIAILRTNQFYAYAVTPFEIIQQQRREQQAIAASTLIGYESPLKRAAASAAAAAGPPTSGKLPTIPVESLSDVDVLRNFVKRLSIFGFTTRQQFEEYFMTFLLLINKVYDENMVDQQEQFQIKSTCLEAILELLITYKTFPIVGNKLSHFHHTTRWSRINCDSISLKKLHKVQLLVSESNIFYHPNLERSLETSIEASFDQQHLAINDNIIGTRKFLTNQYDLNFIWQKMETYAQLLTSSTGSNDGVGGDNIIEDIANDNNSSETTTGIVASANETQFNEDTVTRNYRYFTAQSGVDFKSSTQLIFDVLMQIIEHNHILVLPNLVKFCEICESRDQIKWIKNKALKLQETIPMDDTISHQHLIYLLCKTQAMLIPTFGELQQLCSLIGNYLKSSHIFIRNATLAGLLCLLECCSKTNTTIGKLSEELALLRDLIVGYINRHGIIDESSMQCSDTHTKLVWTLNYGLIEWTSKFVPQCHLLSNTIIAANNFLRKTNNLNVYLCVLHGLERIVVINNSGYSSNNSSNVHGVAGAVVAAATAEGVGIVTPVLRNKIEKLALDLVKLENEKFSIPALKLLLSCMYMGSAQQLESTELSNGIVQDDPEIIAQQTDKVDILLHCIKSSTRDAAWIYGQVLCQIIRDLVPPNEILTKVIKEFLAINQPHCDVIAMIVYQVFRCAIDYSFLQMLQDWLICSLPTFLALPEQKGVWSLSVIFLSASINLHLIKLFPVLLNGVGGAAAADGGIGVVAAAAAAATKTSEKRSSASGGGAVGEFHKLGQHEIALFATAAQDFHAKLSVEQKMRFRDAFEKFQHKNQIYAEMLQSLSVGNEGGGGSVGRSSS